jgi:hypothetical protein
LNLPAPSPGSDVLDLGWRALRSLFPNLTDPRTYQPLPPPAWTPTPEGKLPSADRDPRVEGVVSDLVDLALMAAPMPGLAAALGAARWLPRLVERAVPRAEAAAETMASRSPLMYNPPVKPARPFAADYPQEAAADAAGRLTTDIEGRPLGAKHVVGRATLGGDDQALPAAELDAVTEALTGDYPLGVAAREIQKNAGLFRVTYDSAGRPVYNVLVDKAQLPQDRNRILAHEIGHALEYFAGRTQGLPQQGLKTELRTVYNDLNNPDLAARRAVNPAVDPASNAVLRNWGPERQGYRGAQVDRELMAEALRAYMSDPNYLKTVAPKTAAAIRDAVNAHPLLSRIVQFNSLAGMAGLADAIDPATLPTPKTATPAFF